MGQRELTKESSLASTFTRLRVKGSLHQAVMPPRIKTQPSKATMAKVIISLPPCYEFRPMFEQVGYQ